MSINSKQFYSTIEATWADAQEQLKAAGIANAGMLIFAGNRYGYNTKRPMRIEITVDRNNVKIEVSGFDMQALVDEIIRRWNFDTAQERLLLGAPVVEGN